MKDNRSKIEDEIKSALLALRDAEAAIPIMRQKIGNLLEDYKMVSTHGEYIDQVNHIGINRNTAHRWRTNPFKSLPKNSKPKIK